MKQNNKVNDHKNKLNVILITQGISRIVDPIVSSKHNIVGIIEGAPREKKSGLKKRIFMFLINIYHLFKEPISLEKFSRRRNIPYYYMKNGSSEQLEKWVKNLNPDIIVVYSMSQLLKENIFTIPKFGTINLHPSLLPKYRGPNPDFWLYYNVDLSPGVTVHYIDKGEDTGDIIYQESYNIPLGIKSPNMLDIAIKKVGIPLVLKALNNIAQGIAPRVAQPKESPTKRARNIKIEEHISIINWEEWPIERIWHVLRGTELWLDAIEQPQGLYKGQRWNVLDFNKCNMSNYLAGKVYHEKSKHFVACRDGKIYLELNFSLKTFIIYLLGGR